MPWTRKVSGGDKNEWKVVVFARSRQWSGLVGWEQVRERKELDGLAKEDRKSLSHKVWGV